MDAIRRYFRFDELGTDFKTEIIAGLTTFITMAYIIVVNPGILAGAVDADIVEAAGPEGVRGALVVATVIAAFVGTLLMALYARRPFAIAPYMGENAFVAFVVVGALNYSWRAAIAAVFVGGVIFIVITVLRLRTWLAGAVPTNLKYAFVVGIGLFLTFIGLKDCGIITHGPPGGLPVAMGRIISAQTLLAVFCLILMGALMIKKVKGAIIIAILATTVLGMALTLAGVAAQTPLPDRIIDVPPSVGPLLLRMDFAAILRIGFLPILLCIFLMDFLDTMGTLVGVSAKAGFLDEKGDLPELEKPMLADAVATVVGAAVGTTTTGTYIESASGIAAGGKSGFASVVTAVMFLAALFLCPVFTAIPAYAYGPALVMVGILMMGAVTKIDFGDMTELIPAFFTIVLMSFTGNIGVGMTAGFVLYPVLKLVTGRVREVHAGLWILSALSLLFFIFYPYGGG